MRPEHKDFLRTRFTPAYSVPGFGEHEFSILERYGAWFHALGSGRLEPSTSAQARFIEVCEGRQPPESEYERVWSEYLREGRYIAAQRLAEEMLREEHNDYAEVVRRFVALAAGGDLSALEWIRRERTSSRATDDLVAKHDIESGEVLETGLPALSLGPSGYAPGEPSTKPDWSESLDDLGPADWENHLGGPDE